MEHLASTESMTDANQAFFAAPSTAVGHTSTERLPFTVRIAKTEEDIQKAVEIRSSAYDRHLPDLAKRLMEPEPYDREPGTCILLAESKLDGRAIGTMRVQTNQYRPLSLESSVELPSKFHGKHLAEATRLGVDQGRMGRLVKNVIFKAYYMYCLEKEVDWMVITARSPLHRGYEAILFEDVFPHLGFIPMSHVGNIPHKVLAQEVETCRRTWDETGHPLFGFIFETFHPDIDIDSTALPKFLSELPAARTQALRTGLLLAA